MTVKEPCPICDGSGLETVGYDCLGAGVERRYVSRVGACWTCDGTGCIPAETTPEEMWLSAELATMKRGTAR